MNCEIFGFIADVFIVLSFLFNDVSKIRSFNILGSIIFIVYGCLLGAPSVVILNIIMIAINTYKIIKGE